MKTVQDYLDLKYPVELIPDEDGFVALMPDLPGCMSSGTTAAEALEGLQEAKELWIEAMVSSRQPIPEPTDISEYSGKFVLRIPKSLHRKLDLAAKKEAVSLNQYVMHILSERYGIASVEDHLDRLIEQRRTSSKLEDREHSMWAYESATLRVVGAPVAPASKYSGVRHRIRFVARKPVTVAGGGCH